MHRRTIVRLYHLAEEGNLPSIERDGLFSTSQLLDRAGVHGDDRDRLERHQRRSRTVLPGGVIIRDQLPMPPAALSRCLIDSITPQDWYALINTMVFFWLDLERLARQARACQPWPQLVLELDAERLLSRRAGQAFVTPINTGNARRRPAARGRASFVPFHAWRESGWSHESTALGVAMRPATHPPV
ncbi:MAG: DUF7002 family protein, partial [Candidatus Binataceae bacterium]